MDAKSGLNTMMVDLSQRRHEEDPAKYCSVNLMPDAIAIKKKKPSTISIPRKYLDMWILGMVWMGVMWPRRPCF